MADRDRLELSELVITAWEALGRPGGGADINLRLINEEMAILAGIANPDARKLEVRYDAMAANIRRGLN